MELSAREILDDCISNLTDEQRKEYGLEIGELIVVDDTDSVQKGFNRVGDKNIGFVTGNAILTLDAELWWYFSCILVDNKWSISALEED